MVLVRRGAVAAMTACLLLTACTASSSTKSGNDNGPGTSSPTASSQPAQGITAKTITLSLIWADLSLLSQQHLAPEIGNARKTVEATVADLNAKGGIAGRRIVLKSHVLSTQTATADALRHLCLQATEDDKPFAVIIAAAVPSLVAQCTAVDHQVLTIGMDTYTDSLFTQAQGRLFSVANQAVGASAVARAYPKILQDQGALSGKTVGIIRQDLDDQKAIESDLRDGLQKIGVKVAADAVLPCPEGSLTCSQQPAAIQRMQSANVDFVFLLAQTLPASATVEAAQNAHFTPQWATFGQNATTTVAQFFANAKANFDGAWGLAFAFQGPTPAGDDCNARVTARGAEKFPKRSDGYNFTAVTCLQVLTLADAVDAVSGTVTQAATITALEHLDPVPMDAGPPGTLSATKHYAGVANFLERYSAAKQNWVPTDNEAPIVIGG